MPEGTASAAPSWYEKTKTTCGSFFYARNMRVIKSAGNKKAVQ
jgi:hypothetical protein